MLKNKLVVSLCPEDSVISAGMSAKRNDKSQNTHNLLKLVDVLRTISDKDVSIHCIKSLLKQSATPEELAKIQRCCSKKDKQLAQWYFNNMHTDCNTINTIKIVAIKEMIQFGIKKYYKKCQDFSFVEKIHELLKQSRVASTSISSIPQPNTTGFDYTKQALLIESIMIKIFHYLNLGDLSCCRGVCQQWLHDASNPASVYHVDTFYIRKLVEHLINWKREEPNPYIESEWNSQQRKKWYERKIYKTANGNVIYDDICFYTDRSNNYSNGILKYNANIISYCQSLTIDSTNWNDNCKYLLCYSSIVIDYKYLVPLKRLKMLKIFLVEGFSFSYCLPKLLNINNDNKLLESIQLIILCDNFGVYDYRNIQEMQHLLQCLSMVKQDQDSDQDSSQDQDKYLLNTKSLEFYTTMKCYSSDNIIEIFDNINLTKVESLKLSPMLMKMTKVKTVSPVELLVESLGHGDAHRINCHLHQVECSPYFDTFIDKNNNQCTLKTHCKKFDFEFDSKLGCTKKYLKRLSQDIETWDSLIGLNRKGNMKVDGINLVMSIGINRAKLWMNVGLQLSKSQRLVEIIESMYKWYKSGNVTANLWFQVEHVDDVPVYDHDNLRLEKWIQLIVKAAKKVFCQSNGYDEHDGIDVSTANDNDYYVFDHNDGFPSCVTLLDKVSLTLFRPQHYTQSGGVSTIATTLCLSVQY